MICPEAVGATFNSTGEFIGVFVPSTVCMLTVVFWLSFQKKRFHEGIALLSCYFLLIPFLVGRYCVTQNKIIVELFVLVASVVALWMFWSRATLLRPGGKLSFLMYRPMGKMSNKHSNDGIFLGGLNEVLSKTWGELLLVALFILWIGVNVGERLAYYLHRGGPTGTGQSVTLSLGRATAHASFRLWFAAEVSGHRFGLCWGLLAIPYDRMVSFHRAAGRAAFYCFTLHMILMFSAGIEHPYTLADSFSISNQINTLFGLLAYVFCCLLQRCVLYGERRVDDL